MCDQRGVTTLRESAGLGSNPDRKTGLLDRAIGVVLLAISCVPAVVPARPVAVAAPIEVWVDASGAPDGDGSVNRPLKVLVPVKGAVMHLRSGLYEGPFVLPDGAQLVGHGEVVLHSAGEVTVTAEGAAGLEGLSVQGGQVGLLGLGALTLRRVHFSGHRRAAVEARVALTLDDAVFDGTVPGTKGVVLTERADARLEKVRFTGAFSRAIEATKATLDAEDLQVEGPATALHLSGGAAHVRKLSVAGGSGPGVFTSGGSLTLTDAAVNGHEFGLQAKKTKLSVTRFVSRRVAHEGIAALECTGTLAQVELEQSAMYLENSTLSVSGLKLRQGRGAGILIRHGVVKLDEVTIQNVRAEGGTGGDAVEIRDADVEARRLSIHDVAGMGVFATSSATVKLDTFSCERCRIGALVAENEAVVTVKGMTTKGGEGPAVAALAHGTVKLDGADLGGSQAPIWAECDEGARVTVKHLRSTVSQPPTGCILRE